MMKRIDTSRIGRSPEKYAAICKSTWAPVIQHSSLGEDSWKKVFSYFPEYQLFYLDSEGNWLGFANTIPLLYDGLLLDLPDTGWDWLIAKGIMDFETGVRPNTLGGLQIGINPTYRGRGYSKIMLGEAKKLVSQMSFEKFILPIRPTLKHHFPDIPMEDYMARKENGRIYDPWIRTHVQAGAKIIKVCPEAMLVDGTIGEWEAWTGQRFPSSGKYKVAGALSLVDIDLARDYGSYKEPNIWVCYE